VLLKVAKARKSVALLRVIVTGAIELTFANVNMA
jgi:hypothetical protein